MLTNTLFSAPSSFTLAVTITFFWTNSDFDEKNYFISSNVFECVYLKVTNPLLRGFFALDLKLFLLNLIFGLPIFNISIKLSNFQTIRVLRLQTELCSLSVKWNPNLYILSNFSIPINCQNSIFLFLCCLFSSLEYYSFIIVFAWQLLSQLDVLQNHLTSWAK